MAARNPYVIGVPLTDSAAFYGRQEVFEFIKNVLDAAKQNVIVLYGQRRIGKTSVLHRAAQWLAEGGGLVPVYFDLQGKERLRLGDVLENLAQTLARRLGVQAPDPALFDDEGRHFKDRVLPLAFDRVAGSRLVLLVDEFDVLGDELASPSAASETLFPYLQDLIVTYPQIGFVFVVGRRIEELATHFQSIFKQAVYRRIGRLKPEESRALIIEPARGTISYSDDAVQAIQDLAAGHPYFTQLICFEAFNAVKDCADATVSATVVNDVVAAAIESGHGALNWFWEGLPRAERFILSAVAQASDSAGIASKEAIRSLLEQHRILLTGLELKDAPDRLAEWEMLRRVDPDGYEFVVELVRRWVVQEHPLSKAGLDIDYINKRAVRLFENAREAHSEGDLAYACDEYRRALKANPNHSGAQLGLALALDERGQLDEAIVEFERAYDLDEMSARDGLIRARLARAASLEKQHHLDEAVAEYERVLALVPTDETASGRLDAVWQARADAALSAGDLAGAGVAFREVLKHGQRKEVASRIQAALALHAEQAAISDRLDRATAAYDLLLELLPATEELKAAAAAFWVKCGDTFTAKAQLERATSFYSKAVALFPGDRVAADRLEAARRKQDEGKTVAQIFEQAMAARTAGRMDEAREGWKRLIQMDVLSYQGRNLGILLSETIAIPSGPGSSEDRGEEEAPSSRPKATRAREGRSSRTADRKAPRTAGRRESAVAPDVRASRVETLGLDASGPPLSDATGDPRTEPAAGSEEGLSALFGLSRDGIRWRQVLVLGIGTSLSMFPWLSVLFWRASFPDSGGPLGAALTPAYAIASAIAAALFLLSLMVSIRRFRHVVAIAVCAGALHSLLWILAASLIRSAVPLLPVERVEMVTAASAFLRPALTVFVLQFALNGRRRWMRVACGLVVVSLLRNYLVVLLSPWHRYGGWSEPRFGEYPLWFGALIGPLVLTAAFWVAQRTAETAAGSENGLSALFGLSRDGIRWRQVLVLGLGTALSMFPWLNVLGLSLPADLRAPYMIEEALAAAILAPIFLFSVMMSLRFRHIVSVAVSTGAWCLPLWTMATLMIDSTFPRLPVDRLDVTTAALAFLSPALTVSALQFALGGRRRWIRMACGLIVASFLDYCLIALLSSLRGYYGWSYLRFPAYPVFAVLIGPLILTATFWIAQRGYDEAKVPAMSA